MWSWVMVVYMEVGQTVQKFVLTSVTFHNKDVSIPDFLTIVIQGSWRGSGTGKEDRHERVESYWVLGVP